MTGIPKPLIILTADKDAQFAIQELMRRPAALGIRSIEFDCYAHPEHDSGVYKRGHEFLRAFLKWDHALVVFDREGCGHDEEPRNVLQASVENRLAVNGWGNRARTVVIDPELESWIWDASYQINRILAWPGAVNHSRTGCPTANSSKAEIQNRSGPKRPSVRPFAIGGCLLLPLCFMDLARNSKFDGCRDAAFQRFVSTLQAWFPAT